MTPAGQSVGRPCGASVKWTTSPCLTHSLCGQHVIDGVVVLLGQDGQLTGLLILQPLQHGLVVRLGGVLQQVVAQRLVLAGLDLARVLELALDLQLFGLRGGLELKSNHWEREEVCCTRSTVIIETRHFRTTGLCVGTKKGKYINLVASADTYLTNELALSENISTD